MDDQLRSAIADYAKIQVQHMQLMQDGWTKFIPHVAPNGKPATIAPATSPSNTMNGGSGSSVAAPPPASAFPKTPTAPLVEAAERALAENDLNLEESSNIHNKVDESKQVVVGV